MDLAEALEAAVAAAHFSPCAKSRRGVVIFGPEPGAVATGCNAPPAPYVCDGSPTCRGSCGKVCVHAEQQALLGAGYTGRSVFGLDMLHVKITRSFSGIWEATAGGPPSCPDCSKLILASGIAGMWLYEAREGGPILVRYTAREFHDLTLRNCGLHPYRSPT